MESHWLMYGLVGGGWGSDVSVVEGRETQQLPRRWLVCGLS